ncbi:MAG: hypothetical protein WBO12_24950, partial [Xanthobacteraceae bacterium]
WSPGQSGSGQRTRAVEWLRTRAVERLRTRQPLATRDPVLFRGADCRALFFAVHNGTLVS